MQRPSLLLGLAAVALVPLTPARAHESFVHWHDHSHAGHAEHDHSDHAGHDHGKEAIHHHEDHSSKWAIGSGVRYTRYSLHGERAELWETGLGIAYRVTPWLEVGAEATYGWFDSEEGGANGLMVPHLHADVHLPVWGHLELILGGEVGFPGGDEDLVGDHWEFVPHLALRYDTGRWFVETGASYVFVPGHDHDHSDHTEHAEEDGGHHDEHDHEEDHGHEEHEDHHESDAQSHTASHPTGDFHEIVDPHGEQELHYHLAAGVRLLDERLTFEGRISGVHVTKGYTPDRDYLRAGLRTTWAINEHWKIRAEASIPITEARRNQFQGSLSVQVGF